MQVDRWSYQVGNGYCERCQGFVADVSSANGSLYPGGSETDSSIHRYRWAQKMGVPGAVVKDVGLFMKWIEKKRKSARTSSDSQSLGRAS